MPAASETQVRFQLSSGTQPLILVPVFVAGRGPYSFVLDTGAGPTLVSNELADTLGLPRGETEEGRGAGGEVRLVHSVAPSLCIGDEALEDAAVCITDLSFIGRAIGAPVDGDLGHSVLRHFALTLDYAANLLWLARTAVAGKASDVCRSEKTIPFRLAHPSKPLIVVPAFVNGQGPFDIAVDTGASSTTLSLEFAQKLELALAPIPDISGGGGKVRAWRSQVESFAIGSARREGLRVAVSDFFGPLCEVLGVKLHGIAGYNFLRHFRVTVDYPAESLAFD
jgi:predicted aspartyl protease